MDTKEKIALASLAYLDDIVSEDRMRLGCLIAENYLDQYSPVKETLTNIITNAYKIRVNE